MRIKGILFFSLVVLSTLISCSDDESEENITKPPTSEPEMTVKTGNRTLTSEGLSRNYILRVPASYKEGTKMPLVIALHGFGSKPMYLEDNSKLTQLGEEDEFITVYPEGVIDPNGKRFWTIFGIFDDGTKRYDDIQFFRDLITSLKSELTIDEKRIYLTGNSDGGFMTYRSAFVLSSTFAAVAVHAAQFPNNLSDDIKPQGAIPLLHIHGLKDEVVFAENVPDGAPFFNAQESVDYWATNNGANTTPEVIRDDADINIQKWASPTNNADVVYIKAKNGIHEWFTPTNSGKIDSSVEIWKFFEQYSR